MSDTKDLAADMHRLRIGDEDWMDTHGADAHLTEARQLVRAGWRKRGTLVKLRGQVKALNKVAPWPTFGADGSGSGALAREAYNSAIGDVLDLIAEATP